MSLRDVANKRISTHVVYSKDGLIADFVMQTLRGMYGLSTYDVQEVNSNESFQESKDLIFLLPENFEKWVVVVDLDKVELNQKMVNFQRLLRGADNIVVIFKTTRYPAYQKALKSFQGINDIMGSYLRKDDLVYFLAEHGKHVPDQLAWFISLNYGGEVDKLFKLAHAMQNGYKVGKKADVVSILGLSATSLLDFTAKLFNLGTADTQRKLDNRISTLVQQSKLLTDKLGAKGFHSQLYMTLWDFLEVKHFYLQGNVNKEFRKLPESIEKSRERRSRLVFGAKYKYRPGNVGYYNKVLGYTETLTLLQIQSVLLTLPLEKSWRSPEDVVTWLYTFTAKI